MRRAIAGLAAWFRRKQEERDLNDELRAYLENAVEHKMRADISRERAEREARAEIGSLEAVKENVRDVGWETFFESVLQDVRHGARMLVKNPGFAVVALLALTLGIGANTAMFSVIEAVLLRPLPYRNAGQLVRVTSTWVRNGTTTSFTSSAPDFFDWRDQNRTCSSMFAYYMSDFALTGMGEAKRVRAVMSTAGLFSVLEAPPLLGREFVSAENHKGANHLIVLSHAFWQAEFGGRMDVLGSKIELDSEPYAIIGVMPPEFRFPSQGSDAFIPIGFDDRVMAQRGAHYLRVIGRLKPGVTLKQANDDLEAIMTELRRRYPDSDEKWGVRADGLSSALVKDIRPALLILLGAVGLVALIACANISNLLLARAMARQRELAMRVALGARRSRLVRQMLTEGLLLACAAGAASLLIAHWALRAIVRFGPKDIPRLEGASLNADVLAFTLGISVASALLFGMIPALRSAGPSSSSLIASRATLPDVGRARSALLIGEVALSMMLLTGAGLLIRSFMGLRSLNPGFDARGVVTLDVSVPAGHYKNSQALATYWSDALAKLRALPGVTSAAAITQLPMSDSDFSSSFRVEGRNVAQRDEPSAELRAVSPDYFRTMAIPLRQGRMFTEADRLGAARVLLISDTAARMFFPAGDAIGQRIRFGARGGYERNEGEVVGLVGDVRHSGLDAPATPIFYVPLVQAGVDGATIVLRALGQAALGQTARKSIQAIDRDALIGEPVAMEKLVSDSLGQRRFYMLLLGTFAAFAVVLAAVGLYGVISYSVAQRTKEIGIRVALGASRGQVLSIIMRQGLGFAGLGLVAGQALSLMLNRALRGLLVGVTATDAATLTLTAGLLLLIAALACYVPARRAARVDAMVALRFE